VEDNIEANNPKFSPDGYDFCYSRRNCNFKDGKWQIFIQEFDIYRDMGITSVEEDEKPELYTILRNYPNPFNPATTIEFSLPEAGFADLVIYNMMGQKVRALLSEHMTAGVHSVVWNGTDDKGNYLSSGNYFARLLSKNGGTATKTMLLMK
jgi:hypothetical protein